MSGFSFEIEATNRETGARCGIIHTPHGDIETPAFVPVGTQASVKSLSPDDLQSVGTQLFFVNTYHTYLRPGLDVLQSAGGLHQFMSWDKPVITDSGGFQVFSLAKKKFVNIAISESAVLDRERFTKKLPRRAGEKEHVYPDDYRPIGELVRINEDGVTFTSHWDGSTHRFTPEVSIGIQHVLGSDIMIAFDECAPYPTTYDYAKQAMDRTHRWAIRSLTEHQRLTNSEKRTTKKHQALYGVVQGSVYEDLRQESARYISRLHFDGIAIGGVSVGESKAEMKKVLTWVTPHLPEHLPRHLLGVGEIDDIFELIAHGVDTFDCVQPTRLARMGRLYVKDTTVREYQIDIMQSTYASDMSPIDPSCICYSCRTFSRAYLHHLFRVRELLAYRLASIHNIHFVVSLVKEIRKAIFKGNFDTLKSQYFPSRL